MPLSEFSEYDRPITKEDELDTAEAVDELLRIRSYYSVFTESNNPFTYKIRNLTLHRKYLPRYIATSLIIVCLGIAISRCHLDPQGFSPVESDNNVQNSLAPLPEAAPVPLPTSPTIPKPTTYY